MAKQKVLKFLAALLVAGLVVAGSGISYIVGYNQGINSELASWQEGDWSKLNEVLLRIERYYFEETDREKLLEGAIYGIVQSLDDPFSAYMNKEELENRQIQLGDTYSGIGVEVTMENNRITILAPFAGSPAEEAGLLPGDQIVEVDGLSLEGMSLNEAVHYIRGEAGTELTLGIVREGRPNIFQVTLTRAEITRDSLEYWMLDDTVGYIKLTRFASGSPEEFSQAVSELKISGMKGLILDLRDNPGGYVPAVVDIARQVVPQGLIFYTEDRQGNLLHEYRTSLKERGYPMVVLVNANSASASEILSGALQDNNVPVVGEQTFGKGVGQSSYPLEDGSAVILTTFKFFTPSGQNIHEDGITPDYVVEMDAGYRLPPLRFVGTLEVGSEALPVFQLQRMFVLLEYLNESNVTGVYDEATAQAVTQFQQNQGLDAIGKVNLATTEAINEVWEQFVWDSDLQFGKALEVIRDLIN